MPSCAYIFWFSLGQQVFIFRLHLLQKKHKLLQNQLLQKKTNCYKKKTQIATKSIATKKKSYILLQNQLPTHREIFSESC